MVEFISQPERNIPGQRYNRPFRLVHFVFPNTDHVIILRKEALVLCFVH